MICKYAEIFCWKNLSSFCSAKAIHIFSAKNIRILYIKSAKTVNEMTLNELIKLTTLWTTGPSPLILFGCVQVLWPSQPTGVMSSMVSLLNTFTGQALSTKRLTSIVHILLPPDNCPSWFSRRERLTVENISCSISTNECYRPSGGQTRNLLINSMMHIQLSHWCRLWSVQPESLLFKFWD